MAIVIHALGGGGINIGTKLRKELGMDVRFADTSTVNHKDAFIFSDDGIGSGGIRTTNVAPMLDKVNEYFRSNRLTQEDPSRLHILLFTAAGGSGSTLGTILLNYLLDKGESVLMLTIGDSRGFYNTRNTLQTIQSLQAVTMKNGSSASMMLVDNNVANGNPEDYINGVIKDNITTINKFYDDNVVGIDVEDMKNFFRPTAYKDLRLPNGIYGVNLLESQYNFASVSKHNEAGLIPIIARKLTTDTSKVEYDQYAQIKVGSNGDTEATLVSTSNLIELAVDFYRKKEDDLRPKEVKTGDVVYEDELGI